MTHESTSLRMSRGFTVVEAVVVIGVLSILIALAGPALSGMLLTQQVKNASYDLYSSLTLARGEALTRNVAVTLTPTEGDWARGWAVVEEGGTVIRRQSAYARISMAGPAQVIFSGDGRPDSTATPFAFTALNAHPDDYRCVRMRLNGRPRVTKGGC